jgi:hypothetical protein
MMNAKQASEHSFALTCGRRTAPMALSSLRFDASVVFTASGI